MSEKDGWPDRQRRCSHAGEYYSMYGEYPCRRRQPRRLNGLHGICASGGEFEVKGLISKQVSGMIGGLSLIVNLNGRLLADRHWHASAVCPSAAGWLCHWQ